MLSHDNLKAIREALTHEATPDAGALGDQAQGSGEPRKSRDQIEKAGAPDQASSSKDSSGGPGRKPPPQPPFEKKLLEVPDIHYLDRRRRGNSFYDKPWQNKQWGHDEEDDGLD